MARRYSIVAKRMLPRVCAEYLEMPGLCLTRQQAQRLWGLDEATCAELLDMLIERGFLHETRNGTFARLTEGRVDIPRPSMLKAHLPTTPSTRHLKHH